MAGKPIVVLEDIVDQLEETTQSWDQYLNTETGEFVGLSDGTYIETDDELAEEIKNSSDHIKLPSQYDLYEYKIMEDFAETIDDAPKSEKLFRALNGRKPFRHFKDTLIYTDLDEAYYTFRSLAFLDIAREWCEENHIQYKNRDKRKSK